jgi:hypothetical protein
MSNQVILLLVFLGVTSAHGMRKLQRSCIFQSYTLHGWCMTESYDLSKESARSVAQQKCSNELSANLSKCQIPALSPKKRRLQKSCIFEVYTNRGWCLTKSLERTDPEEREASQKKCEAGFLTKMERCSVPPTVARQLVLSFGPSQKTLCQTYAYTDNALCVTHAFASWDADNRTIESEKCNTKLTNALAICEQKNLMTVMKR